ncbi:MAG: hypothetical protein DRQ51_04695 [Gammaproteobacteria bacterium]|nr:MAG: hypothetical protein DRQ51_04695 [Gammaproteobacteria bacterium]
MSDLICPHCTKEAPHGAKVCQGCQAEIHYGEPPRILMLLLRIVSVVLAIVLAINFSSDIWYMGVIVAVGGYFAGRALLRVKYADEIDFLRIYKTK